MGRNCITLDEMIHFRLGVIGGAAAVVMQKGDVIGVNNKQERHSRP